MKTRKILCFLGRIVIISFSAFTLISAFVPQLSSRKLENVDPDKYRVAVSLSTSPVVTIRGNEFFVTYNPLAWMVIGPYTVPTVFPRSMFLTPTALRDDYFDFIVAHELGHLQHSHGPGFNKDKHQIEADNFAARIVGKERALGCRLGQGYSDDHYLIRNLR